MKCKLNTKKQTVIPIFPKKKDKPIDSDHLQLLDEIEEDKTHAWKNRLAKEHRRYPC